MAPELIKNFRHLGGTVDWWASGVLLYEMLSKEVVCASTYLHTNVRLTFVTAISWICRRSGLCKNSNAELPVARCATGEQRETPHLPPSRIQSGEQAWIQRSSRSC